MLFYFTSIILWKLTIIKLISKPDKPKHLVTPYRPISLLLTLWITPQKSLPKQPTKKPCLIINVFEKRTFPECISWWHIYVWLCPIRWIAFKIKIIILTTLFYPILKSYLEDWFFNLKHNSFHSSGSNLSPELSIIFIPMFSQKAKVIVLQLIDLCRWNHYTY